MEKEETLTTIMQIEHGLMRELLSTFRMRIEREGFKKKAIETLNKFKEKEENHISVEENIIFKNPASKLPILDVIKKQHIAMHDLMLDIEKALSENKDPNPSTIAFQEFMKKHVLLEEKSFYPLLDKDLSKKEREELILKVKDSLKDF